MRIGIDGHNLVIPKGTGVATYGSSLVNVLTKAGHQVEGVFGIDPGRDPATRETLFFDQFGHGHQMGNVRKQTTRSVIWNHGTRPLIQVPLTEHVDKRGFAQRWPDFSALWTSPLMFEVARARFMHLRRFTTVTMPRPPAVMHWTYPVPLRVAGCRNVYTLHDLVPLKLPHTTLDNKRYYHRLIAGCIATGDHVLTVSEASRRDIIEMFDVPEDKVTNTYQSSPLPPSIAASSTQEDCAMVERLFGLPPKGFYLFFGAQDPKKNIARIIDGYLMSGSERPLVVVTSRDWGMDGTMGALAADGTIYGRKPERPIVMLQYLPREMLFRLIRAARAVLFPSIYEGFGLPALEGIQLGTPIISSNSSSLPEVVGEAGLQVDPYSTDEIAQAIRRLDNDEVLYERLCAAAPAQAARFTDDAFLARVQAVYTKLGLG
ncbi:glycosyltransferase family 1 protein [Novosphingobium sp. AP12]|uniref:glycosyltransferase family 4 protein n=1 Tax=Novosphingobium sp. AP12 TaxID=1144305 RepID=UPI0002720F92|nr:glycosyltransferase family 1 protein [Novosphingobium sp. AP12]EJL33828.1 glycosyltransferase [Novosphingobium sp. AP12]